MVRRLHMERDRMRPDHLRPRVTHPLFRLSSLASQPNFATTRPHLSSPQSRTGFDTPSSERTHEIRMDS